MNKMPTIPPAPPLPLETAISLLKRNSLENQNKTQFLECLWSVGDLEVQRACFFARMCLNVTPKECSYLKVNPILQTGPTCGLCALAMVFCGMPTVDDLMKQAMSARYTNNGEMFSAKWLDILLKENLSISNMKKPDKVRSYLYDGLLDSEFIKEKLRQHCMLLVPYDADKNNTPCKQNGHKAHWALVIGYLVDNFDDFHVFARHGKTKNLALFSLKDLSDSNNNLNEFAQPTWHPNEVFILPEDGISGKLGLKNKSIVVEGLQNEVVKIV